jgi:Tfp pilus assembly protein FimT
MEIMVVIVIMAIVSIFTYTPYMLYKNKAWVNVVVKEIAQDLYLARSMAINWTTTWTGTTNKNLSIWLYLEAWKNKKIKFYWYSWSLDTSDITKNSILLKENLIENNIQINNISSASWALFFFSAITWKPEIYLKNSWSFWTASTNTWFTINVSYKWTTAGILSKEITYNKSTFVIDY